MTYDELLAKLSSSQVFGKQFGAKAYLALRAVVELHFNDYEMCGYCEWASYPCKTIEVIEKELSE